MDCSVAVEEDRGNCKPLWKVRSPQFEVKVFFSFALTVPDINAESHIVVRVDVCAEDFVDIADLPECFAPMRFDVGEVPIALNRTHDDPSEREVQSSAGYALTIRDLLRHDG